MYHAALTNRKSGYYAISYQGRHNSSKSQDMRRVDTFIYFTRRTLKGIVSGLRSGLRTDRDSKITT